ncbi:MAG TPA: PadR family transcriptional regulator, partial [Acidimicrobiia bacterium]
LADPHGWHYGYDMVRYLDVPSGTVYPILMRLHDRGILQTKWEDSPLEGRPRRHLYRLTEEGTKWARSVTADQPAPILGPMLRAT